MKHEKHEPDEAIEVTPAMIDEGVRFYLECCPDTGVGDSIDRKMVAEIFEAMRVITPQAFPNLLAPQVRERAY